MDTKEIEAAKRMKNTVWSPALKNFYEPQDVIRYFKGVERDQIMAYQYDQKIDITPPESFFKKSVLKKGLELIKQERLLSLKRELEYLQEVKIPELNKVIKELETK